MYYYYINTVGITYSLSHDARCLYVKTSENIETNSLIQYTSYIASYLYVIILILYLYL